MSNYKNIFSLTTVVTG